MPAAVVVSGGAIVEPDFPVLEAFDHVVVALPGADLGSSSIVDEDAAHAGRNHCSWARVFRCNTSFGDHSLLSFKTFPACYGWQDAKGRLEHLVLHPVWLVRSPALCSRRPSPFRPMSATEAGSTRNALVAAAKASRILRCLRKARAAAIHTAAATES